MSFGISISKVARMEIDFHPDKSDPTYSFLELTLHHINEPRPDKIHIFPVDAKSADHLHNLFLSSFGFAEQIQSSEEQTKPNRTPATRQMVNLSKALLDDANAECAELRASIAEQKQQLHDLSCAYVRLRTIIPGALDTPHAPTPEQIWAITEAAAKHLVEAQQK